MVLTYYFSMFEVHKSVSGGGSRRPRKSTTEHPHTSHPLATFLDSIVSLSLNANINKLNCNTILAMSRLARLSD